jgi:radical SAM protein with 4Fe4S-binding SPASM domain
MKCKHCFVTKNEAYCREPSLGQLKIIIDRLSQAKVFNVTLTGGEPLLRPDFFEIVNYLKQYPIRIGLNTNATLVTEEVSKEIARFSLALRISVSLDGASKESIEQLRGPKTFNATLRGLKNLLKYNKNVRPFCVVTRYNFKELEAVIKLVKSLGAQCLEFNCLSQSENSACYAGIFLNFQEKKEAMKRMLKLKETYGNYIGGSFVRMAQKCRKLSSMPSTELLKMQAGFLQNCDAGFNAAAVRVDGKVSPCYAMLDYVVGDILKEPLADIWRDSLPLKELRRMHKVSLDEIEECKGCIYKGVCNAGCRASAYYHSGKRQLDCYDPEGCFRFLLDANKREFGTKERE